MARTVAVGQQDFETIRGKGYFYIDKTKFIKEWWDSGDSVTLITRPRRFGKTLTMSMLEYFFSVEFAISSNNCTAKTIFCWKGVCLTRKRRSISGMSQQIWKIMSFPHH